MSQTIVLHKSVELEACCKVCIQCVLVSVPFKKVTSGKVSYVPSSATAFTLSEPKWGQCLCLTLVRHTACCWGWGICPDWILWILGPVRKSDWCACFSQLAHTDHVTCFIHVTSCYVSIIHFSFLLEWNWTQPSSCLHPYVRSKYFTFSLHPLGFPPFFTTFFLFQTPFFLHKWPKSQQVMKCIYKESNSKISRLSLDSCSNSKDPHPKFFSWKSI